MTRSGKWAESREPQIKNKKSSRDHPKEIGMFGLVATDNILLLVAKPSGQNV